MRALALCVLLACASAPPPRVQQTEQAKVADTARASTAEEAHVGQGVAEGHLEVTLPSPETPASVAPLTPLAEAVASQHHAPARPPAPGAAISFGQRIETPKVDTAGKSDAKASGEAKARGKQDVQPPPPPKAGWSPPWWVWLIPVAAIGAGALYWRLR